MFWRRKNRRLKARLDTVVERSEQVRKSYRPKAPRVKIDTSFVERPTETEVCEEPLLVEHIHDEEQTTLSELDDGGFADGDEAEAAPSADQPAEGGSSEEVSEQFALLEEAVEQFEKAVAREEDALKREAAARKEAADHREAVAQLTAEVSNLQEIIRANDTRQEEAGSRIAALEADLAKASEAGVNASKSDVDDTDGQGQELEALKALIDQLESELDGKETARQEAEAAKERAVSQAKDAEDELTRVRKDEKDPAETERRIAEMAERETSAREETAVQRDLADKFKAEAEAEKERRCETEAARDQAVKRAEDVESELTALRGSLEKSEQDWARETTAKHNAEIENERKLLREAEADRDQAVTLADELDTELTALRKALEEAEQFNARDGKQKDQEIGAARKDADEQRKRVQDLEKQLAREATAKRELEARMADVVEARAVAERESADLRDVAAKLEVAVVRETEARKTVTATRQESKLKDERIQELESEISDERKRRGTAEAKLETSDGKVSDLKNQLTALRTDLEKNRSAEQKEAVARELADTLRQEVADQGSRIAELEARLIKQEEAKSRSEADRDEALRQAEKAEKELAVLRKSLEQPATSDRQEHADRLRASSTGPSPIIAPNVKLSGSKAAKRRSTKSAPNGAENDAVERKSRKKSSGPASERKSSPTDQSSMVAISGEAKTDTGPPSQDQWTERRAKRTPTRSLATLSREGGGQGVSCTIRDKSSGGAEIEIVPEKLVGKLGRVDVGDRLTLAFASSRERTTVECEVVWMTGEFCGVKYCGPFQTENLRKQKSDNSEVAGELTAASKAKASKSGAGRLKRAIVGGR